MSGWLEHGETTLAEDRWPLAPIHLLPRERWLWWEQLWADVLILGRRCRRTRVLKRHDENFVREDGTGLV